MRRWVHFLLFSGLLGSLALLPLQEAAGQSMDGPALDSMLKQNRADMEYLDTVVSNLPADSDLQKEITTALAEAVRLDFAARMWRLQGRSADSFRELRASRQILRQGFEKALAYYIDTGWVLLESSAPDIVRSEDPVADHYMKLAFRDLEAARILYEQGRRYSIPTPTLGIHAFHNGLHRIRRARRYGLLALIESRTPTIEKDRYLSDALSEPDNRSHYQIIQDKLVNLISRKLLSATIESESRGYTIKLNLLELHDDNYGHLLEGRERQLDRIFDSLNTDTEEPSRDAQPEQEKPDQNP